MFKDPGSLITGVFGSSVLEPMPPILIFETKSTEKENMKVKPSWCSNLPIVTGFWGFKEKCADDTYIALHKKGDKDEHLFIQTVLFYKSLFPNVIPKFKWEGGTIIEGPIFIKSDSGSGKNCKSEQSIKFHSDMHLEVVHIGPGLPNSTSFTQELDDWFQEFKVRTDSNEQTLFQSYVCKFAKAMQDHKDNGHTEIKAVVLINDDIPAIINEHPEDLIKN